MSTLYIPNSIALRNFDSLFKSNNFDFSDKKVDIGFHPKYVAMHPVGLAFYASLADRFEDEGAETTATIDYYKIRSMPYLQRMGLFRVFNDYKDIVTPYSGMIQVKKYAELQNAVDLNDLFVQISAKTKEVREEIYRLFIEDCRYFD